MSERTCWCGAVIGLKEMQCECCRGAPDCKHRRNVNVKQPNDLQSDGNNSGIIEAPPNPIRQQETGLLIFPWDALCTDNRKSSPVGAAFSTTEYRAAKKAVETCAVTQWRAQMIAGPVQLHARAYFPDRRRRDAGNLRKLVTDALQKIVYPDDSLIWRETWERGGIDHADPRLEVRITPYRTEAA